MASDVPPPKKGQLKIATNAAVCQEAVLIGDITVGEGTVIHPQANIIADAGPIVIGSNNIIEEQATIKNVHSDNATEEERKKPKTLIIGSNNIFEVGCYVEAAKIGDANVLEVKSVLHSNCIITNGCVIGSLTHVQPNETIPENTVIFGERGQRKIQPRAKENHLGIHPKHQEILLKILPNFHHLQKSDS